jgi:hypothetical protein
MSKVQQQAAGGALKESSFNHPRGSLEVWNYDHSSLSMPSRDVQSAVFQCSVFPLHWCSVQCTTLSTREMVLLHLCTDGPGDSAFRRPVGNLLISKSGRLVWVSYVISEPGRNQLSAPHRRRGCGIRHRGAASQKLHRRKSSTNRTWGACWDPLGHGLAAGLPCQRAKAARSLSPSRRLSLMPSRLGKVQSSPRRVHCLFDMEAMA